MSMIRQALLVLVAAASLQATELVSWDKALQVMRGAEEPPFTIIYVGHPSTRIMRSIAAGQVDLPGIQLANIRASEMVMNPFTNKQITGAEFIRFYAGIVQDYAAGTFFFLDKRGILIPNMILPHGLHRDRPEVLELYAAYAVSGMYDKKMSLIEFGIADGRKEVTNQVALEIKGREHATFDRMMKQYKAEDPFLIASRPNGQTVNPKTDAAIYVLTKDPQGPIFHAVMIELWKKLTIVAENGPQYPPLMVIGPAGVSYPTLDAMGIRYAVATATEEQLAALPTPGVMFPGTPERPAYAIYGFVPGEVIGNALDVMIQDHTQYNPDIPIGALDWEKDESPR